MSLWLAPPGRPEPLGTDGGHPDGRPSRRLGSMKVLKTLLEKSPAVVVMPIATLWVSAILFGFYGAGLAVVAIRKAVTSPEGRDVTVLVGLYSLFVGPLDLPENLRIRTVDELKARLASVVILFVAIAYVKVLVDWRNPQETLLFGISTGILIFGLVHYYRAKELH